MDMVGSLPKSDRESILAICDYATWNPETITCCTITSKNIATKSVNVFIRRGPPDEILAHQVLNSQCALPKSLYPDLDRSSTNPYHPQKLQGFVQAVIRSLC